MIEQHCLSVARSCRCAGAFYREPTDWLQRDSAITEALNGLTEEFPRLGFWKYVGVLSARGYPWNHKRIYRVYCRLGLNQRRRTKHRLPKHDPIPLMVPQQPNQV